MKDKRRLRAEGGMIKMERSMMITEN